MPAILANNASVVATNTSGTTTPSSGTSETWTIAAAGANVPALSPGQTFQLVDLAQGGSASPEYMQATVCAGPGATSITVTRGVEGSPVVAHGVGAVYALITTAYALQAMALDHIGRVLLAGHSIAASGGAALAETGWAEQVCGTYAAELIDYSQAGSILINSESMVAPYGGNGDGGYAHFMGDVPFSTVQQTTYHRYMGLYAGGTTYALGDIVWSGADLDHLSFFRSVVNSNVGNATSSTAFWLPLTAGASGVWTYEPAGRVPFLMWGVNDLGYYGTGSNTITQMASSFVECLRPIIAAATCAEIVPAANDARCTVTAGYGAAFPAAAGSGFAAGQTGGKIWLVPSNTSDTQDFVTTPDWPGGYVTLSYIVGAIPTAGTFQATVDGNITLTKNLATTTVGTPAAGKFGYFCLRVPVTAGYHHVQVKQTVAYLNGGGGIYTDAIILDTNTAPCVVWGVAKPITGAPWTAYYTSTLVTNANIDTLNTAIKNLCAEFGKVFYADPTLISQNDPTLYYPDGLHPNVKGHSLLAATAIDLVATKLIPSLSTEIAGAISRTPAIGRKVRNTYGLDNAGADPAAFGVGTWGPASYTCTIGASTGTRYVGDFAVRAEPGDLIEITCQGYWNNDATARGVLDFVTLNYNNTGGLQVANYVSTGTPTAAGNGLPANGFGGVGDYPSFSIAVAYKVKPEDCVLGNVMFRLYGSSATAGRKILCNPSDPIILTAANVGAAADSKYNTAK